MKFLLSFLMFASFILPNQIKVADEIKKLNLVSENYLLYSVDNDEIIVEKNSNIKLKPASILKILTTITALEELEADELNKYIIVKPEVLATVHYDASIAGFQPYQRVTIKEILYGIILPSGADATALISDYLAGSEKEFVHLMNKKAQEIGMINTTVVNASGLDEPNQNTTLNDLLILLKYALENETFQELYGTKTYQLSNYPEVVFENHILVQAKEIFNFNYFEGAKSGFTDLARRSLSSIASDKDTTYIFISTQANPEISNYVLNQALNDAVKVYSYIFDSFDLKEIIINDPPKIKLKRRLLKKEIEIEPFDLILSNEISINDLLHTYQFTKGLKVPIEKDTVIGQHQIYFENELILTKDIITTSKIGYDPLYLIMWISIILVGILILKPKKKRRRKRSY